MTSCPRCSVALPAGAAFCNLCGAQIVIGARPAPAPPSLDVPLRANAPMSARPGFVAAGRGMAVCHHCGIVAPTERRSCSRCSRPIGTSLEAVPPAADGTLWAHVRCTFTCRQCGQSSPLDEPELDGVVSCPRCNAAQAFDVSAWEEGLAHAHAVADLAGPSPEGRFPTPGVSIAARNPFSGIGVSHTAAELRLSGMSIEQGVIKTRNLWVEASPGHPLCPRCGAPLEARRAGGELITRCVGCRVEARYAVDSRVPQLTPGLLGIAADALRADRRDARLDQTSAGMVMSLRCPQCGAGLTVPEGAHGVDCTFCKTSCRIPSRTLLALKQGDREPAPFWAWFSGPSPKRRELEDEARGAGRPGEVAAVLGGFPAAALSGFSDAAVQRSIEPAPKEETPASARRRLLVGVVVPLAVLALVGLVGFGKFLGAWAAGRTSRDVPQGVSGP